MKRVLVAILILVGMSNVSFAAKGVASYYGGSDGLCGHKTASGERLDCRAHTVAHRTLPLGTVLCITHRGKSVEARVNDRGPFVKGRVLDLGLGTARAIGMLATATVEYTVGRCGLGGLF